MRHAHVYNWTRHFYLETKDGVHVEFAFVDASVQDGVNARPRVLDAHPLADTVLAAGPASVLLS